MTPDPCTYVRNPLAGRLAIWTGRKLAWQREKLTGPFLSRKIDISICMHAGISFAVWSFEGHGRSQKKPPSTKTGQMRSLFPCLSLERSKPKTGRGGQRSCLTQLSFSNDFSQRQQTPQKYFWHNMPSAWVVFAFAALEWAVTGLFSLAYSVFGQWSSYYKDRRQIDQAMRPPVESTPGLFMDLRENSGNAGRLSDKASARAAPV